MKIKNCLELGKECGLRTVGQCIDNVEVHSINLFILTEIQKEIDELYHELHLLCSHLGKDEDLISTKEALEYLK